MNFFKGSRSTLLFVTLCASNLFAPMALAHRWGHTIVQRPGLSTSVNMVGHMDPATAAVMTVANGGNQEAQAAIVTGYKNQQKLQMIAAAIGLGYLVYTWYQDYRAGKRAAAHSPEKAKQAGNKGRHCKARC